MLISPAFAQAAGAAQENPFLTFLPMIAIFVVFYFLLIRPQQKRAKEQQDMLTALKHGDEILTASGMLGKVTGITEKVRYGRGGR